jgi:phosphoglycolate phosphatase
MLTAATQAVLLDLDGTLADTAPDLGYALNRTLAARGRSPLPLAVTRPVTSLGVRGLLKVGFDIDPGHADYDTLKDELLAIYTDNLCRETTLFPGMADLLVALEQHHIAWGVVTNKPDRFTRPLLDALHLSQRAACIISGDTTAHIKPHPAPLLEASRGIGVAPANCIYLGDDRRDVEAGRAAGMKTVIAKFGYLNGNDPDSWGADALIDQPLDLLNHL